MYEIDDYLAIPMDEIHKMKPAVSGNTVFNDLGNQLPHGTYYIVKIVETQSHQFVY